MNFTKGLVPFWNDFAVDTDNTDATLSVNRPEKAGVVMQLDKAWEGSGSNFFSILHDGDIYRMYYESCEYFGDSLDRKIEFEKPLSELRGKKICFEFFIKDAELFSMKIL